MRNIIKPFLSREAKLTHCPMWEVRFFESGMRVHDNGDGVSYEPTYYARTLDMAWNLIGCAGRSKRDALYLAMSRVDEFERKNNVATVEGKQGSMLNTITDDHYILVAAYDQGFVSFFPKYLEEEGFTDFSEICIIGKRKASSHSKLVTFTDVWDAEYEVPESEFRDFATVAWDSSEFLISKERSELYFCVD